MTIADDAEPVNSSVASVSKAREVYNSAVSEKRTSTSSSNNDIELHELNEEAKFLEGSYDAREDDGEYAARPARGRSMSSASFIFDRLPLSLSRDVVDRDEANREVQHLTFSHASALVLGLMCGSGIFSSPVGKTPLRWRTKLKLGLLAGRSHSGRRQCWRCSKYLGRCGPTGVDWRVFICGTWCRHPLERRSASLSEIRLWSSHFISLLMDCHNRSEARIGSYHCHHLWRIHLSHSVPHRNKRAQRSKCRKYTSNRSQAGRNVVCHWHFVTQCSQLESRREIASRAYRRQGERPPRMT